MTEILTVVIVLFAIAAATTLSAIAVLAPDKPTRERAKELLLRILGYRS